MALDHLEVYGGDNICFIPFEDEGLSLCAGMTWVKSASAETVKQFADFVVAETAEFTRDNHLSRKGELTFRSPNRSSAYQNTSSTTQYLRLRRLYG